MSSHKSEHLALLTVKTNFTQPPMACRDQKLTTIFLTLALANPFFGLASVGCGHGEHMSHHNRIAGERPAIQSITSSIRKHMTPQRKAARQFFLAETLHLFAQPSSLASPIEQVIDEWVVPTLARAFLVGRTENTVTDKELTSHPLDKEP